MRGILRRILATLTIHFHVYPNWLNSIHLNDCLCSSNRRIILSLKIKTNKIKSFKPPSITNCFLSSATFFSNPLRMFSAALFLRAKTITRNSHVFSYSDGRHGPAPLEDYQDTNPPNNWRPKNKEKRINKNKCKSTMIAPFSLRRPFRPKSWSRRRAMRASYTQ